MPYLDPFAFWALLDVTVQNDDSGNIDILPVTELPDEAQDDLRTLFETRVSNDG